MKRQINLALIVTVLILFAACGRPTKEHYSEVEFNEVLNFEELFGVFDLVLNETTFEDLRKRYKPTYPGEELKPYYHLKYGKYSLDLTERDQILICFNRIRENHPRVKQLIYNEYKWDRKVLENLELHLLDDTLVGINIDLLGKSFDLLSAFIEKYGDGVGYKNVKCDLVWDEENKEYKEENTNTREFRKWENDLIEAHYLGFNWTFKFEYKPKFAEFDSLMNYAIDTEVGIIKEQEKEKLRKAI